MRQAWNRTTFMIGVRAAILYRFRLIFDFRPNFCECGIMRSISFSFSIFFSEILESWKIFVNKNAIKLDFLGGWGHFFLKIVVVRICKNSGRNCKNSVLKIWQPCPENPLRSPFFFCGTFHVLPSSLPADTCFSGQQLFSTMEGSQGKKEIAQRKKEEERKSQRRSSKRGVGVLRRDDCGPISFFRLLPMRAHEGQTTTKQSRLVGDDRKTMLDALDKSDTDSLYTTSKVLTSQ